MYQFLGCSNIAGWDPANGDSDCYQYRYFQGYYGYKYFQEKLSWSAAEARCQQDGGHLASIHSIYENNFLHQLKTGTDTWFGFNDINTEGDWGWSDGSDVDFENWYPGEPNNCGGGVNCDPNNRDSAQDCAHFDYHPRYNGKWDDAQCQNRKNFICKKNP